jgi:hypothetical protein
MRVFLPLSLLLVISASSVDSFAAIAEVETKATPTVWQNSDSKTLGEYGVDRIICVDGLKLFQTIGPAWGDGAAPMVSTVQLYEERGGKVVPAKCAK